eukprot:1716698-Pleurochrysis_carterae.AAC.1
MCTRTMPRCLISQKQFYYATDKRLRRARRRVAHAPVNQAWCVVHLTPPGPPTNREPTSRPASHT